MTVMIACGINIAGDLLLVAVFHMGGCGRTAFVMMQGIIGAVLVRLPVSWLMSRLVPASLFYIGLATPASSLVQIIFCSVYFVGMLRWGNTAVRKLS